MNDYEIIVVDDGGHEIAAGLIEERYGKDSRIKYIRQENKGLAGARNTGIRLSSGKYLVFLDADDIVLPEKFQQQADYLDKHADTGIVYSGSEWFLEDDLNEIREVEFPQYEGDIFVNLLYGNFIHVNSVMARRDLVIQAGCFNEELRELEDWDLWLRIAAKGYTFGLIPKVLSRVRLRKGSMTSNQQKMNRTMVRVLENMHMVWAKNQPAFFRKHRKNFYHAYHLFRIQAGIRKNFAGSLGTAVYECGAGFIPVAIKLLVKFLLSYIYTPANPTTDKLKQIWHRAN